MQVLFWFLQNFSGVGGEGEGDSAPLKVNVNWNNKVIKVLKYSEIYFMNHR